MTISASGSGLQPPLRVLIVDDSEQMLGLLSLLLEEEGSIVMTATSGREAIEAATVFAPEVAFIDLVLPPPDGWRVCDLLREQTGCEVILMTGIPNPEIRRRAGDLQITLLEKPFAMEHALAAFALAASRIREQRPPAPFPPFPGPTALQM